MRGSERKRIRHKIVEILKNAKIPEVGDDIFSQRSVPSNHETLPLILVYNKSEDSERFQHDPKTYKRNMQIEIDVQSQHNSDAELADELDDLAQFVEDAIEGAYEDLFNFKNVSDNEKLINEYNLVTTLYDTEGAGMNPVGSVRLIYDFEYYTDEDRLKPLPDLKTMGTQYNVNGNTDGDAREVSTFEIK